MKDEYGYAGRVPVQLTIGELSRATALTVKTLRHYHERGVLLPARVDPDSGYRYYDHTAVERARVIKALRALDLPVEEVKKILDDCSDDADALRFLEAHRDIIAERMSHLRSIAQTLDTVIRTEKEALHVSTQQFSIEDKQLPPQLVAGIRMRGRFEQCREAFKKLGRSFGFGLAGKSGMLIYDEEYKEDDADFEPFFPVRRAKKVDAEIQVRELPGGRALCVVHRGPYARSNVAYGRLLEEIRKRGLEPCTPSREIYIKGPGMLFRGNPEKYLTEIQILVEPA